MMGGLPAALTTEKRRYPIQQYQAFWQSGSDPIAVEPACITNFLQNVRIGGDLSLSVSWTLCYSTVLEVSWSAT
jgi:hypothetical protein